MRICQCGLPDSSVGKGWIHLKILSSYAMELLAANITNCEWSSFKLTSSYLKPPLKSVNCSSCKPA